MIRVYTKERHKEKIKNFLNLNKLKHEIFSTKDDDPKITPFDLGISYCYPRKIEEPLLSAPRLGFFNYHPAPLPQYRGNTIYKEALMKKEIHWGVTLHKMDENYDTGSIIRLKKIELHEPAQTIEELGTLSHYFLFNLFKETILELYDANLSWKE